MRIGVSPNGGRWQVTQEGVLVGIHPGLDEAVAAARDLAAGVDGAELVVVGETGDPLAPTDVREGSEETAAREPHAPVGTAEETPVSQQQR